MNNEQGNERHIRYAQIIRNESERDGKQTHNQPCLFIIYNENFQASSCQDNILMAYCPFPRRSDRNELDIDKEIQHGWQFKKKNN